ncbi:glutamate-1-semialdehyde 2,1-aminomutase, putative [Plesiocystis pacifica SIR-1]|uniref:Glutamate-1-semialdehyde 2,1-aminomutase, putative n=1 Tax=Plesiocystis pacifica SIR-1 TaxID=391625 RepID=A6FZB5_9BACT|nr:aminotransferase class III-fold pyridoxal phosphate-dependent enzyme [Plesiocystis pacifica]EDM80999.1 glutamate-1-semialdehyde 2,1-aminomutase, putative [Plesiocystis pacifica SIR-1]
MSAIVQRYRARFADHEALAERARASLPGGVSSDSRRLAPFPLTMVRAEGPRKWDAAGRPFVDLWCGHGALLFGHAAPELVEAVAGQVARGTHFGACQLATTEWAERILAAFPSAERVRFTASGTEAVHLAVRLARAHTGRSKVLRFVGHYHGWLGELGPAALELPAPGLAFDPALALERAQVLVCAHDLDAVAQAFEREPDIAAVVLEPTGPCSGVVPLSAAFVRGLRSLTRRRGAALIFDEIVTGFRVGPGGAQALLEVEPDLTTLAKITCGGLPGGAVAGTRALMDQLDGSIPHLGTFSGNPLSAAAGLACLRRIAADRPHAGLADTGRRLRARLNALFDARGLDWLVYGEGSCLKLLMGHGQPGAAGRLDAAALEPATLLRRVHGPTWRRLRLALLLEGVDMSPSSFVSTAHGPAELDTVAAAFEAALDALEREGALSPTARPAHARDL